MIRRATGQLRKERNGTQISMKIEKNNGIGSIEKKKRMELKELSMLQQWQFARIVREDGSLVVGRDFDVPFWIVEIDDCVQMVLKSDDHIFEPRRALYAKKSEVYIGKLGRRLINCFNTDWGLIEKTYPKHGFSPNVELFAAVVTKVGLLRSDFAIEGAKKLQAFVEVLRADAKKVGLKNLVAVQKRAVSENQKSLIFYINNLFDNYARLLVVRVDLGFTKDLIQSLDGHEISAEHVTKCFQRFIKHLDRKFPALIGYARKLEYGAINRYHFHVFLFFNGIKVSEDIVLGNMVGEHWVEINGGNGKYWNCNASREKFQDIRSLGLGMIQRSDEESRKNLERAALYLVKIDYYVRLFWPRNWKAFTHGQHKAVSGGRSGSPRVSKERSRKLKQFERSIVELR